MPKEAISTGCELCGQTAAIYCPSDSAYLCCNCDYAVHSANFLVARHRRSTLCGREFSGAGIRPHTSELSSVSSVCVSTDQEVSSAMRRCSALDSKTEAVLTNWCRSLGITHHHDIVLATSAVLGAATFAPLRVALATSFWLGLGLRRDTCRDLKRVERITRVPGRMILAVEAKLKRVFKTRTRVDHSKQEGWAES